MSRSTYDFLDSRPSEDEDDTGDALAEAQQDSRVGNLSRRVVKKRKLSHSPSNHSDSEDDSEAGDESGDTAPTNIPKPKPSIDQSSDTSTVHPSTKTLDTKPLKPPSTSTEPRSKDKSGVVYFSTLPPYLRPSTLRHLLTSTYGPILNLFLTPEAPSQHHARVHTFHGNRKKRYTDGWVEFEHRRHAKACVETLNGRTSAQGLGLTGKGGRGRWYKDDVWSLKYLRGFAWGDLMQSAQGEEREREERVRLGLSREKREREVFVEGVLGGKMAETKRRKAERRGDAGEDGEGRGFKQSEVVKGKQVDANGNGDVHRVLRKIF